MNKFVLVLVTAILLSGCGKVNRIISNYTGDGEPVCQGGVEYLQFSSGVTVSYTPDGKVKTCIR